MDVIQSRDLVNDIFKQEVGEEGVLAEDFSNIVDFGDTILEKMGVENFTKAIFDKVGKTVFVDRPYYSSLPSVLKYGWEFGSILQKIQGDLYNAEENESWELEDGRSYDQQIFYKSTASVKVFNSKTTFEIPVSICDLQVRSAFQNAEQLSAFISMIYNNVAKSMTVRIDGLVMRTIDTMMAAVLDHEVPGGAYGNSSTLRAVNLLKEYITDTGDTNIDEDNAMMNPDFIRYSIKRMSVDADRLKKMNVLYNESGRERFTPADKRKTILLNDFAKSAGVYLYDGVGQFNTSNIQLLPHETVPYWQGPGTDYSLDSISSINIELKNGHTINAKGIIGCMFDEDAVAVCNENQRITSAYNAKAEFTNFYYKFDCSYICDVANEQCIVYYIADAS